MIALTWPTDHTVPKRKHATCMQEQPLHTHIGGGGGGGWGVGTCAGLLGCGVGNRELAMLGMNS